MLWRVVVPFTAVVVVVIVAILLLSQGDAAEVRAVYDDMLDAAVKYDADRLVATIDPDYRFGEEDHDGIVERIRVNVKPDHYTGVTEVENPEIDVVGDSATIDAKLRALIAPYPFPVTLRITVHLKRRPEGWKVTGIEVHRSGSKE
jgi:hypothetical protein